MAFQAIDRMKLTNFSLECVSQTITLVGLNREWDLHNFAGFSGFNFFPEDDLLQLQWTVPDVENPWGCFQNHAEGCILKFRKIRLFSMHRPETVVTLTDNTCLSGLSKVIPNTTNGRLRRQWQDDEPFNLLFEFLGGQTIEIQSEMAELEAVERKK
jgi:hypothetical protein